MIIYDFYFCFEKCKVKRGFIYCKVKINVVGALQASTVLVYKLNPSLSS